MAKEKDFRISKLLKIKTINLELKGRDKRQIIAELVELMHLSGKLKNKKTFFKAIVSREKLGSTGIGAGVAIPHGKSDAVDDFILVFARRNEGIDFGALDGEKTYLFFALASPCQEIGNHLKILSEISRIVKDKFVIDRLKKENDKNRIVKIISAAERYSASKSSSLLRNV